MDMFDVKNRRALDFKSFTSKINDVKNRPGSVLDLDKSKNEVLKGYRRKVKRDELFNHSSFNPSYKAMGGDLVHKQEDKKNPYDYPDEKFSTGIPVIVREHLEHVVPFEKYLLNEQYTEEEEVQVEEPEIDAPTIPDEPETVPTITPSRPPRPRTMPGPNMNTEEEEVQVEEPEIDAPTIPDEPETVPTITPSRPPRPRTMPGPNMNTEDEADVDDENKDTADELESPEIRAKMKELVDELDLPEDVEKWLEDI